MAASNPYFPPEIFPLIVSFMADHDDLKVASEVSRQSCKAAEKSSTRALIRFQELHHVNADWCLRLELFVLACKHRFYFSVESTEVFCSRRALLPSPTPHLRLLEASRSVPMVQWKSNFIGPCTLLPCGQLLASVAPRVGLLSLYDATTLEYQGTETPRQGDDEHDVDSNDKLLYTNGHLVLLHFGLLESNVSVWKLFQGDQSPAFVYSKTLSTPYLDIAVVDGKFYCVCAPHQNDQLSTVVTIDGYDVASGDSLLPSSIVVQVQNLHARNFSLFSSGKHLLLLVRGSSDNEGFEVHVLNTDDNSLRETSRFGSIPDHTATVALQVDEYNKENHGCPILIHAEVDGSHVVNRTVSIDESGNLQQEAGGISFGSAENQVMHFVSANRHVFVDDERSDDAFIKLCEYDTATGTKGRNLWTGYTRNEYSLSSVFSNETTVFCILTVRNSRAPEFNDRNIIQCFPR